MNIINTIQAALTALNNDAELFLLEQSRAENEELEHTKDVIVVYPDWRTQNALTQGLELLKTRVYNIDFKTLDEWDNSDGKASTSYESKTSADRIEDMAILADSVFSYIAANNDLFPEISGKPVWRAPNPILRANNGTMSGVSIQLTIVFSGERVCDYLTPTPVYTSILSAITYQTILNEVGVEMTFINPPKSINFGEVVANETFTTDVESTHNYTYLGRYDINVYSFDVEVTKLVFDNSQLISLSINQLINLTYLDLDTNSLPNISIALFPELTYLNLSNNNILSANVDTILSLLDGFGKSNGTLLLKTGNEDRTSASDDNITNLLSKGWSLEYAPVILLDGNTVKWFDYLENVTKDASDFTSVWDNKTGIPGIIPGGLLQALGSNMPKWFINDGILFDGIDNFMKALAFTYNQPEQIYIVFKQVSWTVNEPIFDGNTDNSASLAQSSGASPAIRIYIGSGWSLGDSNLLINTFGIIRVLANNTSSNLIVNNNTPITGFSGTKNMGGFTLGRYGDSLLYGHIQVKEIILRNIADTPPNSELIRDYLANKYSL